MNAKTFTDAGIFFSCHQDADVEEIPYIQDVLYTMGLTGSPHVYNFDRKRSTYVINVHMAAAAACQPLCGINPWADDEARKIVAQTILDLTAPADRCLFIPSVAEAVIATGGMVPGGREATIKGREERIKACDCPICSRLAVEEGLVKIFNLPEIEEPCFV